MMISYFLAYCRRNQAKIAILIISISAYFALLVTVVAVSRSLPAIAGLPFAKIGVETIVQKNGQIPAQMVGPVLPHSNGPIYADETAKLRALPFVQGSDDGLYFWFFDDHYFKSVLGVEPGGIMYGLLKNNVEEGELALGATDALITRSFAQKNGLKLGDAVLLGQDKFQVKGIIRSNVSGNIIPADVYLSLPAARAIVGASAEAQKLYGFGDRAFVNVVILKSDPKWQGDKEALIKKMDPDYLVFSEKTFTQEAVDQLRVISSFGGAALALLGALLVIAFGLLNAYALKTRQPEIAVLRIIGWSMRDLKRQFLAESLIFLSAALLLGNALALVGLRIAAAQKIRLELPWEISAMPHFLPQENAIARTIETTIPVNYDWKLFAFATLAFLAVFAVVNLLVFRRLKNIKPAAYLR